MSDFCTTISGGGKNVNTDPNFGMTENFKSAIAASNAAQVIDPRDPDFENSTEKMSTVACLTLKIGDVSIVSG